MMKLVVASVVAVALALPGAVAHANPKLLPFSYGTATSAPGSFEVEQYVDIVAMRLKRELDSGDAESTVVPRYVLQTELEYGVTDRVEVGFYLAFRQGASVNTPTLHFQGVKQRVRWRFSGDTWPVGAAAYLEIAEFNDEIELEEKILLEKRFGRFRAVANLWVEQEWYFVDDETKLVYNPTLGAVWQVVPALQLGAEYWVRGRFDESSAMTSTDGGADESPSGARHYAGPTVTVMQGEYWLALGAYVRLDGMGKATPVDDAYGRVWVRLIAGIGL